MEENGVSLDAFAKTATRSVTVILVKNLPSSTAEDDLVELFSPFGSLGRLILPPARTIALIEYSDRNEAKAAYRKLAYTKFKGVPLYLEWAPHGIFSADFDHVAIKAEKERKAAENSIKNPIKTYYHNISSTFNSKFKVRYD